MAEAYQEAQEHLQEQEVYENTSDIHIDVPKDPEVNPALWRDVEPMIFRGFIVLPAEINGVNFLFKSLNHHEYELLQWMFAGESTSGTQLDRFYDMFMAFGVFMIDGQNILPERERWLKTISETFGEMAVPARSKMIRHLSEVNRRATNAIRLVEAYTMESISRFRWSQYRGMDLVAPSVTGIQGTEKLGLNWAQLTWRSLNYYEDIRDQNDVEWEHAKFVGSCFAGKGISKVYAQDNERRKKDKEERVKKRDKLLRQVVLLEPEVQAATPGTRPIHAAETVEELARQLERDLRGEADWHDEVVRAEEERLRQNRAQRQAQLEALAKQREKDFQGRALTGTTDMSGMTREEVQQRIQRRRQVEAQRLAQTMVIPRDPTSDEDDIRFSNSWLDRVEGEPPSVSLSDKDPSGAIRSPARKPGVPFRR